jgi:hypothetical protein
MSRDRSGILIASVVLICLGVVWALALWIGWDRVWPIFPLLGGLGFLVGWVGSGFKEDGLVFVGTAAVLLGIFFFGFSLGFWEWGEMSKLWPVFPGIGGLAFIALFLADPRHDPGSLVVGVVALVVGVVGLLVSFGYLGSDVWRFWPVLLILGGLIGLVGALARMLRRE